MQFSYFDPAPITRLLRAKAGSQLLIAAVHHFDVFGWLDNGPVSFDQLREHLQLNARPAMVLIPSLCAMNLIQYNRLGNLEITALGRMLLKTDPYSLAGYVGLEKDDPAVLHMRDWLKNDGPADKSQGLSYVKDAQAESPMDDPERARFFTLALAGRAKYLSPLVARALPKVDHLLDVAGGSGYYTFEWLLANPGSTATLVDRPDVLEVARELIGEYDAHHQLRQRVQFFPADMLTDTLPSAGLVLAASLFHDWPEDVCRTLATKFAGSLRSGGEFWVHDSFLNDNLDGPLPVTDYSAMLFLGTRGRAYSRKEFRSWFEAAGLTARDESIPTLMDYGLISAAKAR